MTDIKTYPDRELMALSLADRIAGELRQNLEAVGATSLCVPGGSTPSQMFRALSDLPLDWKNVTIFLNDERWVDAGNPRSNSAMIRKTLLTGPAEAAHYLDLYTGEATPEDAAPALSEQIKPHLPITVLVLGMGDDKHTASLFPGAPGLGALLANDAPPVMAASGGAEPRITLTAPALHSALNTHIMITGAEKRAALDAAMGADPETAPISAFLRQATVHYAE
ncbi:6-phosphogluconolactonase [Paracoccus aerodenitrificans]|uniref:6-phosphogluconolactonase n=1 Tax=Paracoccus aerodenitrificans TaxID=3017781 RepID=UPI0022F07C1E|nr:6-phosphogluconolactonase [Paracoccus aerodenitrificans]WBU65058.1 6-phosphogluconolactonase [Paracoccus aerodenitrificans]